jgi:hypothetical protein
MRKKEIKKKFRELELHIAHLEDLLYSRPLYKEDAKKRDYIVRTKYIGKLKDKNLIQDFKKEFTDFDKICNEILNYDFTDLLSYYETLKLYEKKQIVIDVYGTKA